MLFVSFLTAVHTKKGTPSPAVINRYFFVHHWPSIDQWILPLQRVTSAMKMMILYLSERTIYGTEYILHSFPWMKLWLYWDILSKPSTLSNDRQLGLICILVFLWKLLHPYTHAAPTERHKTWLCGVVTKGTAATLELFMGAGKFLTNTLERICRRRQFRGQLMALGVLQWC